MLSLPPELARRYDTLLERKGVAVEQRPHYRKWLRCYWDFCHQYAFEPTERQSLPAFHEELRAKNQPEARYKQAEQAVTLFYLIQSDRSHQSFPIPSARARILQFCCPFRYEHVVVHLDQDGYS